MMFLYERKDSREGARRKVLKVSKVRWFLTNRGVLKGRNRIKRLTLPVRARKRPRSIPAKKAISIGDSPLLKLKTLRYTSSLAILLYSSCNFF